MSVQYFAVCHAHKEYVAVTDNKGNPPNREELWQFLSDHDVNNHCELIFINEYKLSNLEEKEDYIGYWTDDDGKVYKQ